MKKQLLKGAEFPPQSTTEKVLTRLSLQHDEQSTSREDEKFLAKIEKEITLANGHYQLPLPFRKDNVKMPNNREQAEHRAFWIRKKFVDEQYKEDYVIMYGIILTVLAQFVHVDVPLKITSTFSCTATCLVQCV